MNYEIAYIEAENLFLVTTKGKMMSREFIKMGADILAHKNWQPGGNVVFDHRLLDFSGATQNDLDVIRDFHQQNEDDIGDGKSAVIVTPGLSEKWRQLWLQGQKISSANRVEVFDDLDIGKHWVSKT